MRIIGSSVDMYKYKKKKTRAYTHTHTVGKHFVEVLIKYKKNK